MGFFIAAFLLSIPALIFSILSWRLRTAPMFWLGVAFTGGLLLLYIYDFEFLLYCFANADIIFAGIFLLILLGIPLFFLINSKLAKSSKNDDITDDYLNSIINEKDEDINFE